MSQILNFKYGKVLVTGGCGFIGSHLVSKLYSLGAEITVIDDLSTGNINNLKAIANKIRIIISRVEDCDQSLKDKYDGVFHLAAQASVPLSIENMYCSSATNILSTLKIIDHCSSRNTPLVYASSSAIYGNQPFGDEAGEVDLLTPYAVDKYTMETYCSVAFKVYGMRSYGLRFFNVYGPKQDPKNPYSGVISLFADNILKNKPITVNGGYQTRDFVYVADVVNGILSAYDYIKNHSVATYSNLLTGSSVSIDYLAESLFRITDRVVNRIYKPLPDGDPVHSNGSISLMKQQLELDRFISLDEGLYSVIEWMKSIHE